MSTDRPEKASKLKTIPAAKEGDHCSIVIEVLDHCRKWRTAALHQTLRNDINQASTRAPIALRGHGDQPPPAFRAPHTPRDRRRRCHINANRVFQVAVRSYLSDHNCIERFLGNDTSIDSPSACLIATKKIAPPHGARAIDAPTDATRVSTGRPPALPDPAGGAVTAKRGMAVP